MFIHSIPIDRVRGVLLAGLMLMGAAVEPASARAAPLNPLSLPVLASRTPEIVPGKVIVAVDNSASVTDVQALASAAGANLLRSNTAIRKHVLSVSAGTELATVNALKGRAHVRYVEPVFVRHLLTVPTPDDPLYSQQSNLTAISAPDGWNVYPNCLDTCQGANANGPLVAVVDSGIDLTNPDLADRATGEADVYGHGTHVSGIIAAGADDATGIAGLAYNVRLASYKACDSSGSCDEDDIENSIDAAVALGAKVINLSLGSTDYSQDECDAIGRALGAGVVVVAAAGNNGVDGLEYPAACGGVIAVSATDSSDNIASFSNGSLTASQLLVAAPGVNVLSTLPKGNVALNSPTGFGSLSGTSMATPHVTALVALMRGLNPNLGVNDIQQLLIHNSDKVGGVTYGFAPDQLCPLSSACSWNDRFGYGRINVARTLCAEIGNQPEVDSVSPSSGPMTGGTRATITGRCFYGVTAANLGQGNSFTVDSPSKITVVTGSVGIPGPVDTVVTTTSGQSGYAGLAGQFTFNPVVTGISPTSGPMAGSTEVTITGQGFDSMTLNGTHVFFGNTQALGRVYCPNDSTCQAASPPGMPGVPIDITVSAHGGKSAPNAPYDQFTYQGPTITRISPQQGSVAGGDLVDIYGPTLATNMTVRFGSTPATVIQCLGPGADYNYDCQVRSPAATGQVHITVTVDGFSSTPTSQDLFTYVVYPTLTGITPSNGLATGGTRVTIFGTNFSTTPGGTTFSFGPNAATNVTCTTSTMCSATTPAGALTVDVRANVGGVSNTSPAEKFSYIPVVNGISPTSGPQYGGTQVTFTGAGLSGGVMFGSTGEVANATCTPSSCTVVSPAGTGTVNITMTVGGLTAVFNTAHQFTYVQEPLAGWTRWYGIGGPLLQPLFSGALTYDTVRKVVLDAGTLLTSDGQLVNGSSTWTWSGGASAWSEQSPNTSPPARRNTSLTFDQANGTAVLFGGVADIVSPTGQSSFRTVGDTWTWNGSNWTQQFPTKAPSARGGASMAYDAAHKQVVLFGGGPGILGSYNDTWTWNGTTWSLQTPATSPPARQQASMAYDATHGNVVLLGGVDGSGNVLSDTWLWNGTTWTQQHPVTSPPALGGAGMAYHPASGGVLLLGGGTWGWNGTTWTQLASTESPSPSPASGMSSMGYDAATNLVVMLASDGTTWTWGGN